jgi:hypothetical protein
MQANQNPLNNQLNNQLNNYINMLMNHQNRLMIRSILMTLIDCSIIYDNLNNGEVAEVNDIQNDVNNHILPPNDHWLIDSIMNLVNNATRAERIHIFNVIVNIFQNPNNVL